MKARGASVPLSEGLVEMYTNTERSAENREGGEAGIENPELREVVIAVPGIPEGPEIDAFRSGFRGANPGEGKGTTLLLVRCSTLTWGAEASGDCNIKSLNGEQK